MAHRGRQNRRRQAHAGTNWPSTERRALAATQSLADARFQRTGNATRQRCKPLGRIHYFVRRQQARRSQSTATGSVAADAPRRAPQQIQSRRAVHAVNALVIPRLALDRAGGHKGFQTPRRGCPATRSVSAAMTSASRGAAVLAPPNEKRRLAHAMLQCVVEVSFVEWTREGLLRHPEFVGLRINNTARRNSRMTLGVTK